MAPSAQKLPPTLNVKKKDMKDKIKKEKGQSLSEKNKMGQEIEEIFRINKKKRLKPGLSGEQSTKENTGTAKEDKKVSNKKKGNCDMVKKTKGFHAEETSENCSKRRKTADGLALYSAEELGIGNPDAGSTPLCPFDCSCCF